MSNVLPRRQLRAPSSPPASAGANTMSAHQMTPKPIQDRIVETFGGSAADRAFAERYLEILLENWRSTQERGRRLVGLTALLIAAFFLLAGAKVSEVEVAFIRVTNVATVVTFIPLVVSFIYFELLVIAIWDTHYEALRTALVRELYPTFFANDLQVTLGVPAAFTGSGAEIHVFRFKRPGREGVLSVLDNTYQAVFILAPVGFLVYAFIHLLEVSKADRAVVIGGAVVAAINVVRAQAIFWLS